MKDRQHNEQNIPKVRCMSFIDLKLLVAPLVYFVHCVVCPSLIYGFWLHLWYLLPIVSTQWAKDTKGATRSRKSMTDIQHNGQKIPKVQPETVYQ
jgi:uncharacterized membrane protein